MIKLFLFDIEGTTTDIKFVHDVLFPYAEKSMREFVLNNQNQADVARAIAQVKQTVEEEEGSKIDIEGVIQKLLHWIKIDRKHGALKELQGLIWDAGYLKNDFKGHVYEDVKPFFLKILDRGCKIGIYSSGSVHAQKLIFGYSLEGDLTPLISYYFDTKIGGKREKSSYVNIAKEVNLSPAEILFFSDVPEELAAARSAGFNVIQLLRPGTASSQFEGITDFRVYMSLL